VTTERPKTADGFEQLVFTPPQVAAHGKRAVEDIQRHAHRALGVGIADLEDYLAPMLPGEVGAIIAQTHNGKSAFIDALETNGARQIEAQGRDEVLVHISVEELIETQAFRLIAKYSDETPGDLARGRVKDEQKFAYAVRMVGTVPIYRIGYSLETPMDAPELYLTNMIRCIEYLRDDLLGRRITIAGLFFDYLQAFPIDPEVKASELKEQRRLQVRSDVYRLFSAAREFKAPVWVAVQAKQHLDGALGPNMLVPGVYDGEETSSIGQRFDRVVSLWMPKQTHSVGQQIEHKNLCFTVEENLMWVRVCKQRGGLPAGRVFPCRINFASNVITTDRTF
jgi:hypothetical protein